MEEILQSIDSSLSWIAIMLTCHVLFKDCNGGSAIKSLEETIAHECIGDQLARISGRLDKITEKLNQIK